MQRSSKRRQMKHEKGSGEKATHSRYDGGRNIGNYGHYGIEIE